MRVTTGKLSMAEWERLSTLEDVIKRGVQSFVSVGEALMEVRGDRLYRETHETFEDYCRERWGFRREVADRYVRAAEVVAAINPIGLPQPANEAVARELAPLCDDPDELRLTWTEAVAAHGQAPTAEQVRAIRRAHQPATGGSPDPEPGSEPSGDPEHDTRFEVLEDVVEMVRELLPPPEQCVFPDSPGDVEALDEAVAFLANWTPRLVKRWRQHKTALRERVAA